MIITLANATCSTYGTGSSGGIAKSILADNLAVLRTLSGRKVILLDNDPQHPSLDWCSERRNSNSSTPVAARPISGKSLQPELENLSVHYHDIVIDTESRDCMGSRSALIAAHVAVIAIDLDQLDLLDEDRLIERVRAARSVNPRLRILVVMTGREQDPTLSKLTIIQNLVRKIDTAVLFTSVIQTGNALHDAHQSGLSISEYQPIDHKNIVDMRHLFDAVFANH